MNMQEVHLLIYRLLAAHVATSQERQRIVGLRASTFGEITLDVHGTSDVRSQYGLTLSYQGTQTAAVPAVAEPLAATPAEQLPAVEPAAELSTTTSEPSPVDTPNLTLAGAIQWVRQDLKQARWPSTKAVAMLLEHVERTLPEAR